MYYPNKIEDICYNPDHIEKVLTEIKANFESHFKNFVETEGGNIALLSDIDKLADKFGTKLKSKISNTNLTERFRNIIATSISDFEKDRQSYIDILDIETLSEYSDDPGPFKRKVLRNDCPIIRKTLNNVGAKELDKYRIEFESSDPGELLEKVINIVNFGNVYKKDSYKPNKFESVIGITEMGFQALNSDVYIVYGVIGGGIKSHFLYKLYPYIFPNRSHDAIWAIWYLTSKKRFNCTQDSEFLMINTTESTTQQNYFYPYDLFSYYALFVYDLLKMKAVQFKVEIPKEYRFVIVDAFLSFIASGNYDEIKTLKHQIKEYNHGL